MTEEDIVKIETVLGLTLPQDYREHLANNDDDEEEHGVLDDTTAIRDAEAIIGATKDYRAGFEGLPPWPPRWLYMGDESDACPFALDCDSGRLRRLDKGNLERPPLEEHVSFGDFLEQRQAAADKARGWTDEPLTRADKLRSWMMLLICLFGVLVVMPVILFSLKLLYRYLVHGEVPRYEPGW